MLHNPRNLKVGDIFRVPHRMTWYTVKAPVINDDWFGACMVPVLNTKHFGTDGLHISRGQEVVIQSTTPTALS